MEGNDIFSKPCVLKPSKNDQVTSSPLFPGRTSKPIISKNYETGSPSPDETVQKVTSSPQFSNFLSTKPSTMNPPPNTNPKVPQIILSTCAILRPHNALTPLQKPVRHHYHFPSHYSPFPRIAPFSFHQKANPSSHSISHRRPKLQITSQPSTYSFFPFPSFVR